jgi:hypothetical protein
MNLRHLSDEQLMTSSQCAVKVERESTTKVLHHFREIERRRLYSAHKYSSLFDMAVKFFGYTEDQANFRISAMRLLKELPELEEKVNSGELTLTHLSMARSHFRNEEKFANKKTTKEEKLELVEKMQKTSKREAQVILRSVSSIPVAIPHDEIKPINENKSVFKFAADKTLEEDIKLLKGLLAHKYPNLSMGELFKKLCELGLEEWSPSREPKRRVKNLNRVETKDGLNEAETKVIVKANIGEGAGEDEGAGAGACAGACAGADVDAGTNSNAKAAIKDLPVPERGAGCKRLSKAQITRQIWQRDNKRCTNCGSAFAIQKDHRQAKALGGDDSIENLRLLCRSCNQRAAIEQLGLNFMDPYLN